MHCFIVTGMWYDVLLFVHCFIVTGMWYDVLLFVHCFIVTGIWYDVLLFVHCFIVTGMWYDVLLFVHCFIVTGMWYDVLFFEHCFIVTGMWYDILLFVNFVGVVSNAFLIAFTSSWGAKYSNRDKLIIVVVFEVIAVFYLALETAHLLCRMVAQTHKLTLHVASVKCCIQCSIYVYLFDFEIKFMCS